ncbi:cell division protein SepF [Salimicrobium humidisoli]|uniref:Cell division protein SepF n=1 Tax=Salimicrobium humidisoli TaxID=2029857 RepID=A0ABX4HQ18_9BACI|nr:cell division protein SepF [Salimicrobium humidisoli]PBB05317.1 cell division protein SepF [Salimicrobium humidisoli]
MSMKNRFKSFFTLDEDYEYVEEDAYEENETGQSEENSRSNKQQNVVSLKSAHRSSKMVLHEPRNYSEAQDVADELVSHRAVVINLQRVERDQAKRIVDFLSGTVYAIGGDIQKLGSQTFLCVPENVEISGSISEIMQNEDEFNRRW